MKIRKATKFILILALVTGALGLYFYQKNIYSKDILRLEIISSEQVNLLDEIEYIVKYKNNGNTRLEEPELIFEYPKNAIPLDGNSQINILGSDKLGEAIYPGQEKTISFKARLLGKEGEALEAKAVLKYRPKNLKPKYESSTTFTTIIKSVPITFEFDLPSRIEAAKDLKFRINYFSNIGEPLSNLRIVVEYPSNFEFIESTPRSLEKTEWEIGLLNKAEGGRVEISGKVFGALGEEKMFRAKLGTWKDGEFILLKEIAKGISIIKPSLYVSQQINGSPELIASPGDILRYEIFFKNLGSTILSNMFLTVKLEGSAFDFSTLKAPQGDFKLGDDSIIFDWKRISKLQFLDEGEEGSVEFWINLKDVWPISGSSDKNPVIKNNVYLSQIREEFINKVNSKLAISQRAYYNDEIFGNSGALPPEVGQATTYTIMWQVENYYNAVENVKVKTKLPQNVDLTGNIFPTDESSKFAFDSLSREIIWETGSLKASEGVSGTPARNISFQVRLTPSFAQRGTVAEIIGEAVVTGEDQWTGEILISSSSAINTSLPDDKTITDQQKTVK